MVNKDKVIIELRDVKRKFIVGDEKVYALRGVSFKIYEGEFVTIMGTSGSGKSTLLNQLGCLDTPSSGEYILDGMSVRKMSKNQRARLRNRKIGFVFQNYNLLPKTTSVENVELPLMYNKEYSAKQRKEAAIKVLKEVGLGHRLDHKPNQMSGGQMQRVAIARALVEQSGRDTCRRGDRQSRHPHLIRDARAVPKTLLRGTHDNLRDTQSGTRQVLLAQHPAARRTDSGRHHQHQHTVSQGNSLTICLWRRRWMTDNRIGIQRRLDFIVCTDLKRTPIYEHT